MEDKLGMHFVGTFGIFDFFNSIYLSMFNKFYFFNNSCYLELKKLVFQFFFFSKSWSGTGEGLLQYLWFLMPKTFDGNGGMV